MNADSEKGEPFVPERGQSAGRPSTPAAGERSPFGEETSAFAAPARPPLAQRVFPVSSHLKGYLKRYLRVDTVAGVTVAALAIPSGMAYAEVAGLSPVAGWYALLLPCIAYALFGSSRLARRRPRGVSGAARRLRRGSARRR